MRRKGLTRLLLLFLAMAVVSLGGLARELQVAPALLLSFSLTAASIVTLLLRRTILRERREMEEKEE
ncbi:MAG: hypothetical protein V3U90_01795 [Dehalococcoidia bacterium]